MPAVASGSFTMSLKTAMVRPMLDWFHFNPDRLTRKKHWGAYPTEEEKQQLEMEPDR